MDVFRYRFVHWNFSFEALLMYYVEFEQFFDVFSICSSLPKKTFNNTYFNFFLQNCF
jgi:hypothetical protein